jgi:hypothetical protein
MNPNTLKNVAFTIHDEDLPRIFTKKAWSQEGSESKCKRGS